MFASTAIDSNEDLISAHPQYFASSSESTTVTDLPIPVEQLTTSYPALPSPDSQQHSEELRLEKKFEERLNEIEDELRRLTKLSQMLPFQIKRLKSNVYIDQTSLRGKVERTSTNSNGSEKKDISDYESRRSRFRPGHAKFHYHRVESRNSEKVSLDRLVGSEFWNRVASLKQNDTFSNPLAKRNAIVAVSLGPLPPTVSRKEDIQNNNNQDQLMQATEPLGLTSGPTKLCKKKCHVGFKKQRQRKNRIDNTGAKVEKSQMLR